METRSGNGLGGVRRRRVSGVVEGGRCCAHVVVVRSAADEISGETVAIKLVTRVFEKVQLAKRVLREITLLRHFANHENITGLIDVDAISPDFQDVCVVFRPCVIGCLSPCLDTFSWRCVVLRTAVGTSVDVCVSSPWKVCCNRSKRPCH